MIENFAEIRLGKLRVINRSRVLWGGCVLMVGNAARVEEVAVWGTHVLPALVI